MEEKILKNWAEFKPTIDEIREKYGFHSFSIGADGTKRSKNTILFRGQQNSATWKLETTLERKSRELFSVFDYYRLIINSVTELESYTGVNWNIPNYQEIIDELNVKQNVFMTVLPLYNYLVYLRHHGYPSPLLDWTESPYVAAYFAMCETPSDDRVAIYAYIEMPNGKKSFKVGEPHISLQGPKVRTDKRHFAQKAWYTVATRWSNEKSEHVFCSHHAIFDTPENSQDILVKITIPSACRKAALSELNDYNINHFTLFQSEDALVKTLSMKDFDN